MASVRCCTFVNRTGARRLLAIATASPLGQERYNSSLTLPISEVQTKYDAIVIGAGHNGLISAAYLARHGLKVGVFERRHVIGGAAVTEEIVPGYKFSRASYVLSLLRPQIIEELELKRHGLKIYVRDTGFFTPILENSTSTTLPRSLCLGPDEKKNEAEIAKFSRKDVKVFVAYEKFIQDTASALTPLLDSEAPDLKAGPWKSLKYLKPLYETVRGLQDVATFYEFVTAPISKTLHKWFETDVLKGTLATDGITGAMISPDSPGSSYVLLHHKIGQSEGIQGAWGFAEGGMGAVSTSIAKSAKEYGVDIFLDQPVAEISLNSGRCVGVTLSDGKSIQSDFVLSNATPKVTFCDLLDGPAVLPEDYHQQLLNIDYTSPVTKINVATDSIPNFSAIPNKRSNEAGDHHKGTIHLNCESISRINDAYLEAQRGRYSSRPMIEMVIPSSMDPTIAPEGRHVVSLFTQYTPYYLEGSREWTDQDRGDYKDTVLKWVEEYAPGFTSSVVGYEVLTPMDLERVFGLTGGNIFHGAMSLDQLFLARPVPYMASHRTPVKGLYLCGSGSHPGGGVMGASGKLAACAALSDLKTKKT